jgi:hypothetical protein
VMFIGCGDAETILVQSDALQDLVITCLYPGMVVQSLSTRMADLHIFGRFSEIPYFNSFC